MKPKATAWVREAHGIIKVRCDFDWNFIEGAKAMGGVWEPREKVWVFPIVRTADVEVLLHTHTRWRGWPTPAASSIVRV